MMVIKPSAVVSLGIEKPSCRCDAKHGIAHEDGPSSMTGLYAQAHDLWMADSSIERESEQADTNQVQICSTDDGIYIFRAHNANRGETCTSPDGKTL